jgi:hypothetical protein
LRTTTPQFGASILTGAPSRDGSPMIEWRTITLSDGTELGVAPLDADRWAACAFSLRTKKAHIL